MRFKKLIVKKPGDEPPKPQPKSRRGKYNAKGEHIDGFWFASAAEGKRYLQLKAMQEQGKIEGLELQPKFPITINSKPITTYRGDFRYAVLDERHRIERVVVEDVKGMVTDVYALKKKMGEASYAISINEIPAKEIDKWEQRVG